MLLSGIKLNKQSSNSRNEGDDTSDDEEPSIKSVVEKELVMSQEIMSLKNEDKWRVSRDYGN